MKKIRIGFYFNCIGQGGLGRYILSLIDGLSSGDVQPVVYIKDSDGVETRDYLEALRSRQVEIRFLDEEGRPVAGDRPARPSPRGSSDSFLAAAAPVRLSAAVWLPAWLKTKIYRFRHRGATKRAFEKEKLYALHVNLGYYPMHSLLCAGIAQSCIPHKVITVHNTDLSRQRTAYGREWMVRGFHKILAVNEGTARELREHFGFPASCLDVIPNGVAVSEIPLVPRDSARRGKGLPENAFMALVPARLDALKGHAVLLDAVSRIKDTAGSLLVYFAGEGDQKEILQRETLRLGIEKHIVFGGQRSDMEALYTLSDCVVLPSLTEGFPFALLEGMAFRKPLLATDVGGVRELVGDRAGLVVPAQNAEALALGLTALMALTEEKREALGRAGQERVQKRFPLKHMIEKTFSYYGLSKDVHLVSGAVFPWKGFAAAGLAGALFLAALLVGEGHLLHGAKTIYKEVFPFEIRRWLWVMGESLRSPYPYLMIPLALFLQVFRPAVPQQKKNLAQGMAQDFIWFQADAVIQLLGVGVYAKLLSHFYETHLNFLTVGSIAGLPAPVKFLTALLIFDFTQWAHHFLRHKVRWLWYFHTIHHSSRAMNFFTDLRVHPAEFLIARTITFIPLFMLQVDVLTIASVAFFMRWYTRLYHANLRTNYGFLKYFLVTPQSHRIHHSLRREHQDKNFGVFFTFWDRAFGTLSKNYDDYPETGVSDPGFPLEKKLSLGLFWSYFLQLLYPFQRMIQDVRSGEKPVLVRSSAPGL